MSIKRKKIAVGMSGGIDSTFAAITLKEQGYNVIGISLHMFCKQHPAEKDEKTITGEFEDVKKICELLSIPYYNVDAENQFEKTIIKNFCESYLSGLTPNPCVLCNKRIKWKLLLEKARELGAEYIATGHYAEIEFQKKENRYYLKKGKDKKKDQSYFLWQLDQNDLAYTIFPLANFSKIEIGKKIEDYHLKISHKPESQEICFIPNDDYKSYLRNNCKKKIHSGYILNLEGKKIGRHKGFPFYTIGQRRGLGLTSPHPLYVKEIRSKTNEIVVGPKDCLFGIELFADQCKWINFDEIIEPMRCRAKIRYNSPEANCTIFPQDTGVRVLFDEPILSITPGQSVVFYENDNVIGGGIIQFGIAN
ncbi:MAG: tRNA 2-thiouridine(34) synthase MnmA [Candidatus Cloacimonadota bacterium]|nr:tRNA 2-thiouridine(34) synthase MnmA [Candidatus Cloacimonadota bacterium]